MPAPKFRSLALFLAIVSALRRSAPGTCSAGDGIEARRAPDALVFRNFTLIDGADRGPLPQAAMVVENGRVSWVGAASDLEAPERAKVTDLNGAFVIPA